MQGLRKIYIILMNIFLLTVGWLSPIQVFAEDEIEFTTEEKAYIDYTKENPILTGIIPHAYPLSACPYEVGSFKGTNIEMLNLISEMSGLSFEFTCVPTEEKTPYEALIDNEFQLVAGTIRLDVFEKDQNLILSDRFCDGSATCIAKKDTNPSIVKTGKIAVMQGYQAGYEFSKTQFPNHEIVLYLNNYDVINAVNRGEADLAMISRYVGIYELQSPFYENLTVLAPYQRVVDSVIMGINTPNNEIAISIINKTIAAIGEDEYNNIQMTYIIHNPYKYSFFETIFKYRFFILAGTASFIVLFLLLARLFSAQKEKALLSKDNLTGAYTDSGFELQVTKILARSNKQYFITVFDISHFSSYNDLYGKEQGDALLKKIVQIVTTFLCDQDAICRSYADNFRVISYKDDISELLADIKRANNMFNQLIDSSMRFSFGIYPIEDRSIPISKMFDYATIAKKIAKHDANSFIHVFDKNLHDLHQYESKILSRFDQALAQNEFVVYYQPKVDVDSNEIIGAEALVRWINNEGVLVPPTQFIELFEKNGQIQKLDFYVLEQVCKFQQMRIKQGKQLFTISSNFSRVHLFSNDFVQRLNTLVEQYGIPKSCIEIECTETAMAYDSEISIAILGQLQHEGYSVAMDDFGQAYSSLNTLRSMPLNVVKLDRGFLLATLDDEKEKANTIIRNIVSLIHDLNLKIVAEGVENLEQVVFLKSVNCDYIQGYYYSMPLSESAFIDLLSKGIFIR
ncbi:EAL domain-containing protein [Anaerorhabdus furcosa]|uniref:Diguanylate cyclase (GGDEF) domain-containing protein n=1 Tax=Anaerorhabdus furcosa TaxID=118967 RepID=A0A1T4PK16_9FIRM|nr:EAL domain-containing protein [Anaerorhabdus furcosa]SJZ91915.1 diguanylate cyclase (GGDEF) domain-containing protein [Anaerorhabdus furcosa]